MSFASWSPTVAGVDAHVILRGRKKPHASMELTVDNTNNAVWSAASGYVGFYLEPTTTPINGTVDWDDGHGPVPLINGFNTCRNYDWDNLRGVFHVRVEGTFGSFALMSYYQYCIKSIDWWDAKSQLTQFGQGSNHQLINSRPANIPALTHIASPPPTVTSLQSAFANGLATHIAADAIADWDTSHVTNMQEMFKYSEVTAINIGNWDTRNVTNMSTMFGWASHFNEDLSGWPVPLIASEPTDFATGTASGFTTGRHPQWGTWGKWPHP